MARYQPRGPLILEAIQWTGDNGRDVEVFACGTFEADQDLGTGRLWNRHRTKIQRIPPGWYVVRGVTGYFFAVSAEDFAATYEPAAGPDVLACAEVKLAAIAEYVRSRPSWVVDPVESRLRKDAILAIIGGEETARG